MHYDARDGHDLRGIGSHSLTQRYTASGLTELCWLWARPVAVAHGLSFKPNPFTGTGPLTDYRTLYWEYFRNQTLPRRSTKSRAEQMRPEGALITQPGATPPEKPRPTHRTATVKGSEWRSPSKYALAAVVGRKD